MFKQCLMAETKIILMESTRMMRIKRAIRHYPPEERIRAGWRERTIKHANYNRTLNGIWQFDRQEPPDRIMKVEQNPKLTVNVNKRDVI